MPVVTMNKEFLFKGSFAPKQSKGEGGGDLPWLTLCKTLAGNIVGMEVTNISR